MNWVSKLARRFVGSPGFAGVTAALAAFVGLIGSVYQEEIVRAFPFVLPSVGMVFSYRAFFFWLGLILLAGCVYLRQVVDDAARNRLTESAAAAEMTSRRIESLVETLPPRAFQTELALAASKVHAVGTGALPPASTQNAEALATVVRHVLHSIASLALIYDDRPRVSGRAAKYSANIMLFVPESYGSLVNFSPADFAGDQLAGVLHLRRELSSSTSAGDAEPDADVPEIGGVRRGRKAPVEWRFRSG